MQVIVTNKMLGRIFSRSPSIYHVLVIVLFLMFIIYELKQMYNRYQKEKRFAFYNTYMDEVSDTAYKMKQSEIKTADQVKELTRVLQVIFKKNTSNPER